MLPKVQGQTRGNTLVVRLTEAHDKALFEMWYRLKDDRALSAAWSRISMAFHVATDHEYSAWEETSVPGHRENTACMTCGLVLRLHRSLRKPYPVVFNISEAQ
ncbi:hypothetical protein FB472_0659 [Rhodoglobus vestalii]|uniref:Uncharacterized protein n=1 Tax=Rhodoglobus vestalii TaxID=193384 RepID=A0A8H2K7I6_9MICO|nr:hypothetical protein FB472_0659 [Rhodoglobus vestalii]